jgi:hypothetical protein
LKQLENLKPPNQSELLQKLERLNQLGTLKNQLKVLMGMLDQSEQLENYP